MNQNDLIEQVLHVPTEAAAYFFRHKLRVKPTEDQSEEAQAVAYTGLVQHMAHYRPERGGLENFAFHRCLNYLKTYYAAVVGEEKDDLDGLSASLIDEKTESRTLHQHHRGEIIEEVREALGRLPEDQRRVVEMRFYDRLSVREIERRLGLSKRAVNDLLKSASHTLRLALS